MEIFNICIITFSAVIILIWGTKKKLELESMKIHYDTLKGVDLNERTRSDILKDSDELDYVSEVFQNISMILLWRITKISFIFFAGLSILVWLLFEEKTSEYGQAWWFFIGAFSQIIIGILIFGRYKLYDPRVIFLARCSKWHAMDYIIKLNCWITITNQGLNLAFFAVTYYVSTIWVLGFSLNELEGRDYEKFHRRFLAYGFGSIVVYFVIKSLTNVFSSGSKMVYECLENKTVESEHIPPDHPRNPGKIMSNVSDSFLKTFEICTEHNALTNMGIC
jgi:hypothetical protein